MKYDRFEDLPVWRGAIELGERIYALTRDRSFSQPGDLLPKLRRAALSISNNIAEGFERGTTAELLMFLYIARGSAGEVRSMLHFADRLADFAHLKSQISDLKPRAESCSRQLRGWADSLQNSDIAGPRHLNDSSRQTFELNRASDAFWIQLETDQRRRVAEWSRQINDSTRANPDPANGPDAHSSDGDVPRFEEP